MSARSVPIKVLGQARQTPVAVQLAGTQQQPRPKPESCQHNEMQWRDDIRHWECVGCGHVFEKPINL